MVKLRWLKFPPFQLRRSWSLRTSRWSRQIESCGLVEAVLKTWSGQRTTARLRKMKKRRNAGGSRTLVTVMFETLWLGHDELLIHHDFFCWFVMLMCFLLRTVNIMVAVNWRDICLHYSTYLHEAKRDAKMISPNFWYPPAKRFNWRKSDISRCLLRWLPWHAAAVGCGKLQNDHITDYSNPTLWTSCIG